MILPSTSVGSYIFSINLIIQQLLSQEKFHTIVTCYENITNPIVSSIWKNSSNFKNDLAWISINLESDYLLNNNNETFNRYIFGEHCLIIYAIRNIESFQQHNISYDRFHWDKRIKSIIIFLEKPQIDTNNISNDEHIVINDFIKNMFKKFMKNLCTIFWNNQSNEIELYNFNLQRNISEKINVTTAATKSIIRDNSKNFNQTTIYVYMISDAPKIIRLPQKYQKIGPFHFQGRDGLIAKCLVHQLNAKIFYKSMDLNQIVEFPKDEMCPNKKHKYKNYFDEYFVPYNNCVPDNVLFIQRNSNLVNTIMYK